MGSCFLWLYCTTASRDFYVIPVPGRARNKEIDNLFRIFHMPCTENSGSSVLNKGEKAWFLAKRLKPPDLLPSEFIFLPTNSFLTLNSFFLSAKLRAVRETGSAEWPSWKNLLWLAQDWFTSRLGCGPESPHSSGVGCPHALSNQILLFFPLSPWKVLVLCTLISYCTEII